MPAQDYFEQLTTFDTPTICNALEVDLYTRRTQNIRVHSAYIDNPLAGAPRYREPEFNRTMKTLGLRRLFLHAHILEFTEPASAEVLTVSTPLGDDLKQVLDQLERHGDD